MMLTSVVTEYFRIKITADGIKNAYEKAIRTVAIENYNEVYAGIREHKPIGGMKEGGPEDKWLPAKDDKPEWVELKDYGETEQELMDLLGLVEENGKLVSLSSDGGIQYELYDFHKEIKNYDESNINKYEVRGETILNIPFYFCGLKVINIDLHMKAASAYSVKY